jgi:hypothetical protein
MQAVTRLCYHAVLIPTLRTGVVWTPKPQFSGRKILLAYLTSFLPFPRRWNAKVFGPILPSEDCFSKHANPLKCEFNRDGIIVFGNMDLAEILAFGGEDQAELGAAVWTRTGLERHSAFRRWSRCGDFLDRAEQRAARLWFRFEQTNRRLV